MHKTLGAVLVSLLVAPTHGLAQTASERAESPLQRDAQTGAKSFGELRGVLLVGQTIVVTDVAGVNTKGEVAEVSAESLVLLNRDAYGSLRTTRFAADSVTQVRRTDTLWNGILIGAGVGVGVTVGVTQHLCGPDDPECSANAGGVLGLALVPASAAAGALIDKLIGNNLIYRPSSPRGPSVAVSPRIGTRGLEMSLSVHF